METFSLQQGLRFREAQLSGSVHGDSFDKLLRFSAISAGFVLLLGIAMFGLRGLSLSKSSISFNGVLPVAGPLSNFSTIPKMLGVNIANNGSIVVNGAIVTDISGNTIKAKTSWSSADFSWILETSGTTKFFDQKGQKQTFSYIRIGDTLTVTGKLTSSGDQLVINADFIRD